MASQTASETPPAADNLRLIWHRRDLRLHDNILYHPKHMSSFKTDNDEDDTAATTRIASVFILDPKDFQPRKTTTTGQSEAWDIVATGPHSCRIMIESLHDLRLSLRNRGSDLWIRQGPTIDTLIQLVHEIQPTEICWHEEPGVYEQQRSSTVYKILTQKYPSLKFYTDMQYTLYHPNDLPVGHDEWDILARPNRTRSKRNRGGRQRKNNIKQNQEEKDEPTTYTKEYGFTSKNRSLVDISHDRLSGMPRIMGEWRKGARAARKAPKSSTSSNIRPTIPTPDSIRGYYDNYSCHDDQSLDLSLENKSDDDMDSYPKQNKPRIDPGRIPTLEDILKPLMFENSIDRPILGIPSDIITDICKHAISISNDDSRPIHVRGGEQKGLLHLQTFTSHHATTARRNLACVDGNDSSRLSHFLAWGCLSPRRIIEEAERAMMNNKDCDDDGNGNKNGGSNKNTNDDCSWLISHMTMRDFFLYLCLSTGSKFYQLDGMPVNSKAAESIRWKSFDSSDVEKDWIKWSTGDTGLPLIDAGMKELATTGYLSNRVRQNAASVLTKDLQIDWRAGAELFQFLLVDHCVGANWGNWLYFSGVGPDPKQRHFRTVSQALRYDRDGTYVKKWLPKLRSSTSNDQQDESYLRPWDYDEDLKSNLVVSPESQYTWHDLQKLTETGHLLTTDGRT